MSQRRVLVVDDEVSICESIAARLRAEGYDVELAFDGPSAVARCEQMDADLVVLDVMMPGFDGLEVCRRIQAVRPVPVLMLTARADETDMLIGLGVGADDYLSKPFSMRVLVARVQALLRRADRAEHAARPVADLLEFGDVVIDLTERRVRRDAQEVHLTRTDSISSPIWRSGREPRSRGSRCSRRSGAGVRERAVGPSTATSRRCDASSDLP